MRTKLHRDTVWGFFAPITPLAPLFFLLSSWKHLKLTFTSMWRDRVSRHTLILLALSSAISTFIARDRLSAVGGVLALYILILFIAYGIWGIERPLRFLRALTIGCGVLGLVVVLARFLQLEISVLGIPILDDFAGRRPRGNVLGMANNGLSALLEPGVAGGLGLAVLGRKRRVLFLIASLLSAAGVLVTLSRGGMVGVAASLVVLLVLNIRHMKRYLPAIVVIGLVLVVLIATVPGLGERIASVTDLDRHTRRVEIWTGTLKMVRDYPIFGSGPANFGVVYPDYRLPEETKLPMSPHSIYLFILSGWGIVGFAVFFGYLAWVTIVPLIRKPTPLRALGLAMAVSFWVHVLVDDLYLPHIPLIMGCISNAGLDED